MQHTLRISHVLATHGVEVSVGDRHMGRELRSSWMAFEKQLRAAAYFMEEQTPAQTSELHRRIAVSQWTSRPLPSMMSLGKSEPLIFMLGTFFNNQSQISIRK